MSFVKTHPESLAAAASSLQGIGSAMTAQNAAAAMPTTGVVPAAADAVSALQATQFAAYGQLYQQISAQATTIHEMFVNTLRTSADTYGTTETANSVATNSSDSILSTLLALFTGNGSSPLVASTVGNTGIIGAMQASNFGSAASDLLQLGSSGFLAPGTLAPGSGALTSSISDSATLASAAAPASMAGSALGPVSASAGNAGAIRGLSVPPSWAGGTAPPATPTPSTLTGAGWTAAAPAKTPVTTMPAGMPAVASADRGGFPFGRPRYGVKPTVMPRPTVV